MNYQAILNALKNFFPKIMEWIQKWFMKRDGRPQGIEVVSNKKESVKTQGKPLIWHLKKLYDDEPKAKWNDQVNIMGFRDERNMSTDVWNDIIVVCIKDIMEWKIYVYISTCDPSAYWSSNKNRRKRGWSTHGAAHMDYGFQKDIWMVGTHRGYLALAQWGATVRIWRDANEDFKNNDEKYMRDHSISNIGFYGINLHHGNNAKKIGLYSAGCQVIQSKKEQKKLMKNIKANEKYKKNKKAKYGYLLKNMDDVSDVIMKKIRPMAV